jgi:AcrR family transcriptional regulator
MERASGATPANPLGKRPVVLFSLREDPAPGTLGFMAKGPETRERILDTAFRLAARDGLEGLSLGGLAGELGMSKSGLFAHFGSKEELQLEMLRTASDNFVAKVMRPSFKQPRGLPRLKALFENWRRWATDPSLPGGCIFVAAAAELDDREGPVRAYVVSQQRELLQVIARAARQAVEVGHFRRDLDVEQFAFEFDGIYLSFHQAHRLMRDPRSAERARRALARLLEDAAVRQ